MKIGKKEWEQINRTMRDLDIDKDSRQINTFKFTKEGEWHRKKKFDVCCQLYESNHPFLCEAYSNNKKRKFDIVDLIENEVIEIESVPVTEKATPEKRTTIFRDPQSERDC